MRYVETANQLRMQIHEGLFAPGARIPSLRQLAARLQISIATAQHAYQLLENEGLLECRPQSGYFVRARVPTPAPPPVRSSAPAAPANVSNHDLTLQVLRALQSPAMIQLGSAVPHSQFLPATILRGFRGVAHPPSDRLGLHRYELPPGGLALRRQIAQRCVHAGFQPPLEQILVTNGCQEALTLALRAVAEPGDIIAVESPAFYGILQALESLRMKALEIPSDTSHGMDLNTLAKAIEQWPVKACVATPNYSNPLGACMAEDTKRRLVGLLSSAGIPFIEDDIFGELAHFGPRPVAAKHFDLADNVIYCSSFSKTIAPGLRIGWLTGGKYHERIEYLKYLANFATATPNQIWLADYLSRRAYDRYLRQVRQVYARQIAYLIQNVMAAFPSETKITQPSGGFLLWVELPHGCDAIRLFNEAASKNIAIAPGALFSARKKFRHHIRLNAAIPWSSGVEAAIQNLGAIAKRISRQ